MRLIPDKDNIRFYRGRSMGGTFCLGDCLRVAPVSLIDVRLGDVVMYRGTNHQGEADELVHRVLAVVPGGLVTRGDNNPCADTTLVTADNLLGRVTHIERDGKMLPVRGGRLGLLRSQIFHARQPVWRLIKCVVRRPYRWLRKSGFVARVWQPSMVKVCLITEKGPLVKYVCGRRTVACWWPEKGLFECQKPYDLVLRREDLAN
ncbi:MAG: hypothetical protein JRI46_04830 [Deltaproteobacteria bacterium]|nr:hypothetical protein [Deltaproteobacteria bacterium]